MGLLETTRRQKKNRRVFDTLLEPCEAIPATLISPPSGRKMPRMQDGETMALAKIRPSHASQSSLNSGHDDQRRIAVQVVQGYLIELCRLPSPSPPVGDGVRPRSAGLCKTSFAFQLRTRSRIGTR